MTGRTESITFCCHWFAVIVSTVIENYKLYQTILFFYNGYNNHNSLFMM
jgi:hypothetical protein